MYANEYTPYLCPTASMDPQRPVALAASLSATQDRANSALDVAGHVFARPEHEVKNGDTGFCMPVAWTIAGSKDLGAGLTGIRPCRHLLSHLLQSTDNFRQWGSVTSEDSISMCAFALPLCGESPTRVFGLIAEMSSLSPRRVKYLRVVPHRERVQSPVSVWSTVYTVIQSHRTHENDGMILHLQSLDWMGFKPVSVRSVMTALPFLLATVVVPRSVRA